MLLIVPINNTCITGIQTLSDGQTSEAYAFIKRDLRQIQRKDAGWTHVVRVGVQRRVRGNTEITLHVPQKTGHLFARVNNINRFKAGLHCAFRYDYCLSGWDFV